jgi:molybdopterin-synthase adenylyltransferase
MYPATPRQQSAPQPADPPRPQLKGVVWERADAELRVVYDRRDQLMVNDPDGTVAELLALLRDGGRDVGGLAAALSARGRAVPLEDVRAAVALLDEYGLLEDGVRLGRLTPVEAERHFSNLAFFESFASLARSREDFCLALRDAHVLVLGTGGLNSNTIPHLCGLGVGRLTLVDFDTVAERNFARQYLYRWSDIGGGKVARAAEWVRAFDPSIEVDAVDTALTESRQVGELLDEYRPNAVASGVDQPAGIDLWVNAACVSRGVPYVRGGMWVTEGIVYSVDPGYSACLHCVRRPEPIAAATDEEIAAELAGLRLQATKPRTNRGIGPVAGLLGALGAFELLRYLTRFEPPAYAGNPLLIDFAGACATSRQRWRRDPDCVACGPGPVGDTGDDGRTHANTGRTWEGGDPREAHHPAHREHPVDHATRTGSRFVT